MRKYAVHLLTLCALLLLFSSPTAQESAAQESAARSTTANTSPNGYKVIIHPDNPTRTLSKKRVSRLLLKEVSRFEGSHAAEPVDLGSKSKVRAAFSKDIHGRSVTSIKNYWQRQIFSGRAVPPPEVESDAAVISFVKSRRGAIGYVSGQARLPSDVKVLTVSAK